MPDERSDGFKLSDFGAKVRVKPQERQLIVNRLKQEMPEGPAVVKIKDPETKKAIKKLAKPAPKPKNKPKISYRGSKRFQHVSNSPVRIRYVEPQAQAAPPKMMDTVEYEEMYREEIRRHM